MFKSITKISLLIYLPLFFSCSSNPKTTDEEAKKEAEKSIIFPVEIEKNIGKYPLISNEYNFNEKFFADSSKNNKINVLSLEEVKSFADKLKKDEINEPNLYMLNDYFKIEKAKINHKYQAYVEKLDIGMTKESICYALNRIEFGDSVAILVWKDEYSSYEACPFFAGTDFFATLITDGKVVETIQLAMSENAGDAPMSSTTIKTSKINSKGLVSSQYDCMVDEDGLEVEHITEKYNYQISKKGFKKVK